MSFSYRSRAELGTLLDSGSAVCGCSNCNPLNTNLRNLNSVYRSSLRPAFAQVAGQPDYINALLDNTLPRWNYDKPIGTPTTVSFSFMNSLPDYYYANSVGAWYTDKSKTDPNRETANQFTVLSEAQRQAVISALQAWQAVAGITFVQVADSSSAQIRFGIANNSDSGIAGWAYSPGGGINGDVWLDRDHAHMQYLNPGQGGYWVILHEIGHALGLKHPFEDSTKLPAKTDHIGYSVMAYHTDPHYPIGAWQYQYPKTPQLYDIAAIQYLYGRNQATNADDDSVYSWTPGQTTVQTIWDAGGDRDMIDASNQTQGVVINLEPGSRNSIGGTENLTIAYNSTIERARGGSGDDWLFGNSSNNALYGNAGKDYLYGDLYGDSYDILFGGTEDDYLYGGGGGDFLSGDAGNDTLDGGWGDDLLYGLGGGLDTFTGGIGADRFVLGVTYNYYPSYFEYAMIQDFNPYQGDKIGVYGTFNDYSIIQQNWIGDAALDTALYYKNNLVAVLKDTTAFSLSRDVQYST